MKHVVRQSLQPEIDQFLQEKQSEVERKFFSIDENSKRRSKIEIFWNNTRSKRHEMSSVFSVLRNMAGPRGRCMYCVDSEGNDIEHFWPKKDYPERVFHWLNMLLCCTQCGHIKKAVSLSMTISNHYLLILALKTLGNSLISIQSLVILSHELILRLVMKHQKGLPR